RSWDSVSTEHGPAIVTNSSPPISKSRTGTTVRRRHSVFSASRDSAKRSCQLSRTASCSISGEGSGYSDDPEPRLHPKVEVRPQFTVLSSQVTVSGPQNRHRTGK